MPRGRTEVRTFGLCAAISFESKPAKAVNTRMTYYLATTVSHSNCMD